MAVVRFVENPLTIRSVPLQHARNLVQDTCRDIERASRRIAPINRSPFRQPGPHLRTTIRSRVPPGVLGRGVTGVVGSEVRHALVAHNGARPHVIRATNASGLLHFYWARVGRFVMFPSVNHPGHSGVPYLTAPLFFIASSRGFVVTIYPVPR